MQLLRPFQVQLTTPEIARIIDMALKPFEPKRQIIIGIGGIIDSGKSTFANNLQRYLLNAHPHLQVYQHHFADALKLEMAKLFGFDSQLAYTQEGKESIHESSGLKIREILQEGAQRLKDLWPSIWAHKWQEQRRKLIHLCQSDIIIAADARYEDAELPIFKKEKGYLIHVSREVASKKRAEEIMSGDMRLIKKWNHPSESGFAVKPYLADFCLTNNRDEDDLYRQAMMVVRLIAQNEEMNYAHA